MERKFIPKDDNIDIPKNTKIIDVEKKNKIFQKENIKNAEK